MSDLTRSAIDLLIGEAWELHREGRYADALNAAQRAVEATQRIQDRAMEVRAASIEATALRMLGDRGAALVRLTWILGVAENPVGLTDQAIGSLAEYFARAYMNWVHCARFLPEIPLARLFEVLDQGELWLRRIGRPNWRSGLLHQRASLLKDLSRTDEAIGFAEEALSLERGHPESPGYTLACYLTALGNLCRVSGRYDEAERYYQEVLNDRATTPYDRMATLEGLARCARARLDHVTARHHAEAALRLAEGMGDDSLCEALGAFVDVCRASLDNEAAAQASERHVEVARRVSGGRLYFAGRQAADLALDRGDREQARRWLDELTPLAEAMDRQHGSTVFSDELATRRARLVGLPDGDTKHE